MSPLALAVLVVMDSALLQAGFAPLHLAVLQMTVEMVNFLLRLEVDPNVPDHQGRTPLHLIIEGPFSSGCSNGSDTGGGGSNQCIHQQAFSRPRLDMM